MAGCPQYGFVLQLMAVSMLEESMATLDKQSTFRLGSALESSHALIIAHLSSTPRRTAPRLTTPHYASLRHARLSPDRLQVEPPSKLRRGGAQRPFPFC
jgi:hypothetical protein